MLIDCFSLIFLLRIKPSVYKRKVHWRKGSKKFAGKNKMAKKNSDREIEFNAPF